MLPNKLKSRLSIQTITAIKSGKLEARAVGDIMQQYNQNAYAKWDTEALLPCQACGRTFRPEALKIHKRSCKVGAPLKKRIDMETTDLIPHLGMAKPKQSDPQQAQ